MSRTDAPPLRAGWLHDTGGKCGCNQALSLSNEPADFFHSRLQFRRDGRSLVSAGWLCIRWTQSGSWTCSGLWRSPRRWTRTTCSTSESGGEIAAAGFGDRDQLLVSSSEAFNDSVPSAGGRPDWSIGTYSIGERRMLQAAPREEAIGPLMRAGQHAVGFHRSPKLFDLATGQVVAQWPELSSGEQNSSIRRHHPAPPPLALAPQRRFALGTEKGIQVAQLTMALPCPMKRATIACPSAPEDLSPDSAPPQWCSPDGYGKRWRACCHRCSGAAEHVRPLPLNRPPEAQSPTGQSRTTSTVFPGWRLRMAPLS